MQHNNIFQALFVIQDFILNEKSYTFHITCENDYTVKMNNTGLPPRRGIKITVAICWLLLVGMLIKRDVMVSTVDLQLEQSLLQAESEEFQSIYFKDSKIGYVTSSYNRQNNNSWLLQQKALMNLNVAQRVQKITLTLEAVISQNNILESFQFTFSSPFYQMEAQGQVTGSTVNYTLDTGSATIHDSFIFTTPPLLATSRRSYLLGENLQVGDKKKIPWFDPLSLSGKESIIAYRGVEQLLINGRVQNLHKFTESSSGARISTWLNDTGVVIKEESPAGFVFIREPKFRALDLPKPKREILSEVAVKLLSPMGETSNQTLSYRLQFPDDIQFDLHGGRQVFADNILTVNRQDPPPVLKTSTCSDINGVDSTLSSSPYIQADHSDIISLSNSLIGKNTNPVQKVKNIAAWVYNNLEKRPVLGIPDALTTLRSRHGDCNEHAALFGALARAASIPTKVVAGVTYHKKAFYYHAWNEVCVGEKWYAVDTTINQFPADATHLRFIEGEIQEQVKIGALLGQLAIEPLVNDTPQ